MKITVFPQTLWWCPPEALRQKVSSVDGLHPLGTGVQEKGFTSTARNLWQEQMRRQKQEYKASDRTGDKTIASKLPLLSLLFQQFSTKNRLSIVNNKEMVSVCEPFSMSSVNQQFGNDWNSRNPPLHWHCCVGYMSCGAANPGAEPLALSLCNSSPSCWELVPHIKDFGRSLVFLKQSLKPHDVSSASRLVSGLITFISWEWHSPSSCPSCYVVFL